MVLFSKSIPSVPFTQVHANAVAELKSYGRKLNLQAEKDRKAELLRVKRREEDAQEAEETQAVIDAISDGMEVDGMYR